MNENHKKWKKNHLLALEKLGFKASQFNRLRQLENIANFNAALYCNGDLDGEAYEKRKEGVIRAIKKLHGGTLPDGFFVNSDPRGYALKIESENLPEGIDRDWGGYGILAPEF